MKRKIVTLLLISYIFLIVPFVANAEGITIIEQENASQALLGGELELKPGDKVKVDGEYAISFSNCVVLGDDEIKKGITWAYLTSKENGAPIVFLEYPCGTHCPGALKITLTNRSKQDVNWLKKAKCTIVFDDMYYFDTIGAQYNPDQLDASNEPCESIEAVDIEPLVTVDVSFIFSVPYIVRDSSKSLIAYISVDQDVYAVNLREYMEILND